MDWQSQIHGVRLNGRADAALVCGSLASFVLLRFALCLLLSAFAPAWALTPEQAARIAAGEGDDRIAALNETVTAADVGLAPFLQAMLADEVKVAGGKAYIVRDGKTVEAGTNAAATLPDGAEDVVNNNRMRREFKSALAALALFSPDRGLRALSLIHI